MAIETTLAIAPLTPVFFGDGRPCDAGETDFGSGRFPPSPKTIQGVVRTALLRSVAGLDLGPRADARRIEALVGPPDKLPEDWQVIGPWLAKWRAGEDDNVEEVSPWLRCPGWIVRGPDQEAKFLMPREPAEVRTDLGASRQLLVGRGDAIRSHLSPADSLRVLAGLLPEELPPRPDNHLVSFARKQPHTGLRLTPGKRTAAEGMLYTRDFYRFAESSGLVVRFTGTLDPAIKTSLLTSGISSLGGKNRVARLLRVTGWDADFEKLRKGEHLPQAIDEGARFLVWATTPVRACDPLDPGLSRISRDGAHFRVLSAALGHPEAIGGFSLARGHGSASRLYLPPGCAWMVEVRNGTHASRAQLLRDLHDSCLLGDDPNERAFGFGHAFVALLPQKWSDA